MKRREGFTLIEMMVATALTLFLMVIISEAFVTALDVFSNLKAIGDMEEGLRTATTILRSDLRQSHFEGSRRLSDTNINNPPPQLGFFCIRQGLPSTVEGFDSGFPAPSFLPSYYANGGVGGANHSLHFTVRGNSNQPNSFFSTAIPATSAIVNGTSQTNSQPFDSMFQPAPFGTQAVYTSPWAEVAYYLKFQGTTGDLHNAGAVPNANVTPLYGLYRMQVVVPSLNASLVPAGTINVASNSPADMSAPPVPTIAGNAYSLLYQRAFDTQFAYPPPPPAPPPYQANSPPAPNLVPALLLNNVVSFNVRIIRNINGVITGQSFAPQATVNDWLASTDPAQFPRPAFDTSGSLSLPLSVNAAVTVAFPISALEISIRVWDQKTQMTRQVTILQDL
jgi:prepilin-type N-terminal cleavage/methylation domain-containing protein